MKSLKIAIFILVGIIVIAFTREFLKPKTIKMVGVEIPFNMPWKKIPPEESFKISILLQQYDRQCKPLYSKEIYHNDFIVACKKYDKSWDYYEYWKDSLKLTGLGDDIKADIQTPE